jgi:predicted CXXCH cytochrome family protein
MNFALRTAIARRAAAAFALACAALAIHAPALAEGAAASRSLEPPIARARGEKCIADPAFMRRNHMDLLKHQRNETVHLGVRDARASLKACISCHASAATGSVAAAKTDFCVGCHSYAAVKVDCFECHASKPQPAAALALPLPQSPGASSWRVAQGRHREAPSASVR